MQFNPAVLQRVSVLKLVNEQIGERVWGNGSLLHPLYSEAQHVLKVDLAVPCKRVLIGVIQLAVGSVRVAPPEIGFDLLDRWNDVFCLPVAPEFLHHADEEAEPVAIGGDIERARAGTLKLLEGQRMEGACDQALLHRLAGSGQDALAQFERGILREGDGADRRRAVL
ncbi:hypothetical protein AWB81_08538 [Caballeronia arationis]|nr:hypothetical protein AWB81_08538 [Caballeronia arationis]